METDSFATSIVPTIDTFAATVPTIARPTITVPQAVIVTVPYTVYASTILALPSLTSLELRYSLDRISNADKSAYIPSYICMEWHSYCQLKTCMSTLRLGHTQIRFVDIQS